MGEMDQEFWNDSYKQDPIQIVLPAQFLEQEIEDLSPGSAVDLGCGVGHSALMLAERGWQVTGVDFAHEAIALANQEANASGLIADFIVVDTTTWQPPHQYDLVITTYALPGGEGSKKVINTAVKSLAPGGTLIIIEWDKSMVAAWGFDDDDLMSVDEITALLPGLQIKKAEVRQVESPFADAGQEQSDTKANVLLVRAQKNQNLLDSYL